MPVLPRRRCPEPAAGRALGTRAGLPVLEDDGWRAVAGKGFDEPALFAAYLRTLSQSCVTATDPNLFQAPFRAGIRIDACSPSRPPRWNDQRVIVFTEYEDTRRYLERCLREAITHTDRSGERIVVFAGTTSPHSMYRDLFVGINVGSDFLQMGNFHIKSVSYEDSVNGRPGKRGSEVRRRRHTTWR